MTLGKYILDNKKQIIPCEDLAKWGIFMSDKKMRIVKQEIFVLKPWQSFFTWLPIVRKNCLFVSTVFLGLDHSFDTGTHILFETCIFGPKGMSEVVARYCTYHDALRGHEGWIRTLRTRLRYNKPLLGSGE